uniref:Uncharacterized protein n=1 Tax=Trichogramma kaykai TaxID=54128 RepID=A0ABD2XBD1_9HYME
MCRICDETSRRCGELRHAHTNNASVIDGLLPNVHSISIVIWLRRDAYDCYIHNNRMGVSSELRIECT